MTPLDPISLGIMWDRLVSITDEVLTALVRTSFSTNVRESYDLSCLLFSGDGTSMAQGTYSVPSFTGTGPATLAHMLRKFPAETLSPGDVVVTNDPWMGTGHLFDINVMRPVFRGPRLVGYSLSITHLPDIGGRGFSATAAEIYEEGLRLPVCKLVRAGQVDADLLDLICTNVRVPEHVVGDLMANVTCNEVAGRLLLELMDEYRLDDLDTLAAGITSVAETAMRERIRAIPDGVYANRFQLEGADRPIALACRVTVSGDTVHIDCDGTDPVVPLGINVPLCYTRAFAAYAVKCLTTPRIPNNEGSLRAITTTAPVGGILNAVPPSATGGRHVVGHFVTPLVFGALAQGIDASLGSPSAAPRTGIDASLGSPSAAPRTAIAGDIPADSGMLNLMNFQGRHRDGRGVSSIYFASGGYGALDGMDGAACTPFPSNMTSTPVETWENLTSVTIERKAFLTDSGGPGRYRGGLGQEIVFRNDSGHPMTVACFGARTEFPPLGIRGGQPGSLRRYLVNDAPVHSKGRYVLAPGDVIRTWEPGGGGFGDPRERSRDAVRADVRSGFVSPEAAGRDYGLDVNADGVSDSDTLP